MGSSWNKLKSFIDKYDYTKAKESLAGDIKNVSTVFFVLWFLSIVHLLPGIFSAMPKILGYELHSLQTSSWVSWLLFTVFLTLYLTQMAFCVSRKKVKKLNRRQKRRGN